MDEHGYLYLSGRADDVIVRGGENISPAEIEDILFLNSGISDVAAVAIPSQQWGEAIALAVVLKPKADLTAESINALIRSKLRSSRVPEVIHFVEELPYNEAGKLLRRVIKSWFS